jgi:hypothetical protein
MDNTEITFDDMVDDAVRRVLQAFGKGEDLRGACYNIVNSTAMWACELERKRCAQSAFETGLRFGKEI